MSKNNPIRHSISLSKHISLLRSISILTPQAKPVTESKPQIQSPTKSPCKSLLKRRTQAFTANKPTSQPRLLSPNSLQLKAIEALKDAEREVSSNQYLISYLISMPTLYYDLTERCESSTKASELISEFSYHLTYDHKPINTVIALFNTRCDYFSLIIEGQVDILVPNEQRVCMTELEYFGYLIKLRRYEELDLLSMTIENNRSVYPLKEKSFDHWIRSAYFTLKTMENLTMTMNKRGKRKSNSMDLIKTGSSYRKSILDERDRRSMILIDPEMTDARVFQTVNERRLVIAFSKDIYELYTLINLKDNTKEKEDNDAIIRNVSTINYINRILPIFSSTIAPSVIIFTYFLIGQYNKGETFGHMMNDMNFCNEDTINFTSLISSKETHIAALQRHPYNRLLKHVYEKGRSDQLNFLYQLGFIEENMKSSFMKNFARFFFRRVIQKYQVIYNDQEDYGDDYKVYFIESGEFKTTCHLNLNQIGEMIGLNRQDRDKDSNLHLIDKGREYIDRKEFPLQSFGRNDIIGLEDTIINGKPLLSIQCYSPTAIVYEVHVKFLEMLKTYDESIRINIDLIQTTKTNILHNLLRKQRKARVDCIGHRIIPPLECSDQSSNKKPKNSQRSHSVIKHESIKAYILPKPQPQPLLLLKPEPVKESLTDRKADNVIKKRMTRNPQYKPKQSEEVLTRMESSILSQNRNTIEVNISQRSETIVNDDTANYINPLVYDDFNRCYNKMPYINKTKQVYKNNQCEMRLTSTCESDSLRRCKSNSNRNKSRNSTSSHKTLNRAGSALTIKLNSIYNAKYKRLVNHLDRQNYH